jgi:hypothetical protein
LSLEELRRKGREEWAAQYGPGSPAREIEKDQKAERGIEHDEEKVPQPGKDPNLTKSPGEDDDYGL